MLLSLSVSLPLYRAQHVAARAGGQRNNRVSEIQPEPANGSLSARSLYPIRPSVRPSVRSFARSFVSCSTTIVHRSTNSSTTVCGPWLRPLDVLAPWNAIKTGRAVRSIRNRKDRERDTGVCRSFENSSIFRVSRCGRWSTIPARSRREVAGTATARRGTVGALANV